MDGSQAETDDEPVYKLVGDDESIFELNRIPDQCVEFGLAIAQYRFWLSREQNRAGLMKSSHPSGSLDPAGAIAEAYLPFVYLNRAWIMRPINNFKQERDVGPHEVESTEPGLNLILREHDLTQGVPRETRYILAWIEDRGEAGWWGNYVGWMTIGEGFEHPNKVEVSTRRPNEGEVWRVPFQDLYTMPDPEKKPRKLDEQPSGRGKEVAMSDPQPDQPSEPTEAPGQGLPPGVAPGETPPAPEPSPEDVPAEGDE
jgi:hypothetical protein